MATKGVRRWLRFSVRTMLVWVALVSVALGMYCKYVFVTRSYPIDDVLADGRLPDEELLVFLIECTISPNSWSCVGGPAKVETRPDKVLRVWHRQSVQDQVASLIERVRLEGYAKVWADADLTICFYPARRETTETQTEGNETERESEP